MTGIAPKWLLGHMWLRFPHSQRLLAASLLTAAGFALAGCGAAPAVSRPAPSRAGATPVGGVRITPPLPRPEFTLTDTSGQAFDFQQETQGQPTLLYFGYTHCPDICPLEMTDISAALDQLPADTSKRLHVVFVTVDPARDTPAVLRQWLDHFSTGFIGLTGTPAEIDQVQRQTGLPLAQQEALADGSYGVDHAAFVLAYTPDNLAHVIFPAGLNVQDWVHGLATLLQSSSPQG